MPLHWPQFAKNGPRLLKNGKIDKKGSLQNCSVCIQNPLKIWYRKSIVWYREIIVSYRESIVSYQEMRAETNLPKNVNWQKMVQNCVKLSNSGIKIKILPKMPLHWQKLPNLPKMALDCLKIAKSAKKTVCKTAPFASKIPSKFDTEKASFGTEKSSFRTEKASFRTEKCVPRQICQKMWIGKKWSRIASNCPIRG